MKYLLYAYGLFLAGFVCKICKHLYFDELQIALGAIVILIPLLILFTILFIYYRTQQLLHAADVLSNQLRALNVVVHASRNMVQKMAGANCVMELEIHALHEKYIPKEETE